MNRNTDQNQKHQDKVRIRPNGLKNIHVDCVFDGQQHSKQATARIEAYTTGTYFELLDHVVADRKLALGHYLSVNECLNNYEYH